MTPHICVSVAEAATATEQESPALYTAEDLMMTASQLEPRLTILAAKRYVSFFLGHPVLCGE